MVNKNLSLIEREEVEISNVQAIFGNASVSQHVISVKSESADEPLQLSIELSRKIAFNSITMKVPSGQGQNLSLKIYHSLDNNHWHACNIVNEISNASDKTLFLPLIYSQYLQVVFFKPNGEAIAKLQITELKIQRQFNIQIKASSNSDRLWVVENLIDKRPDYGWASQESTNNSSEFLVVDLNSSYLLNEIRLESIHEQRNCFPSVFIVKVSNDEKIWQTVISESSFFVFSNSWYSWSFSTQRSRYIKIEIEQSTKNKQKKWQSKILNLDILAIPENDFIDSSLNANNIIASELLSGTVRLSENKAEAPNTVVQASDSRLKKATTEAVGIVKLARDGETSDGVVVQANDRRLNNASTTFPGIVQLAKDNEDREAVAVQANDSRLKKASSDSFGITKLAKDGDTSNGVVVQGGDSRIKAATETTNGIVKLAANKSSAVGTVVQANDQRLREASTSWPGIVQLAQHSESVANKPLQSDDPRLKEGSETEKGRVRFAKDQESVALKAVQSNDTRLQSASTQHEGVVKFADNGVSSSMRAVQSDDQRLSDKREPKPHQHDYAARSHELNSHQGKLNLSIHTKTEQTDALGTTNLKALPFSVENNEGIAAGISGGLLIRADRNTALQISSKKENTMESFSEEKSAAVLISSKDFALRLPKKHNNMTGSNKSLEAEGEVVLKHQLRITNASNVAVAYKKFTSEVFTNGDLLTVNSDGAIEKLKSLQKSCIGIYDKDAMVILNETEQQHKSLYCVVSGIVKIRVQGPVEAGSVIGYSGGNPGVSKAVDSAIDPVAIALETSTDNSERLIKCVLK